MQVLAPEELFRLPPLFDFPENPDLTDPELVSRGLSPPLPVLFGSKTPGEAGGYLIWGRSIAEMSQTTAGKSLDALRIQGFSEKELSLRDAFLLCLRLENRRDRYSPRELERLVKTMNHLDIPLTDPETSQLISTRGALVLAARRLLLRGLPREMASDELIDIKTAENLDQVPVEVLERLYPVLKKLSFAQRRLFLNHLVEVLLRDRPQDPGDLATRLAEAEEPEVLLRELRFPELSSLEEAFKTISSRFFSRSGIQIKPPPFFEGRRFNLSFNFDSPRDLEKKIRVLEKFLREGEEIYELL